MMTKTKTLWAHLSVDEIEHLENLCKLDHQFHPSLDRSCLRKLGQAAIDKNERNQRIGQLKSELGKRDRTISQLNGTKNMLKEKLCNYESKGLFTLMWSYLGHKWKGRKHNGKIHD